MDIEINPLVLFLGILAASIASTFLSGWELVSFLILSLFIPLIFGFNTFRMLWRMKIMLLTAALIALFGVAAEKDAMTVIGEVSRFLALITLSGMFVIKADLIRLSSSLGRLLSFLPYSIGWKLSSYLMLSLSIFPIVFESGNEMLIARKARLGSFFSHPVSNLTRYTVSLMRLLLRKMEIYQDALYSRAFSIKGEKTTYPLTKKDICLLFLFFLLFIGIVIWKKMS